MALTVTRSDLKTFLRANYFEKLDTVSIARVERAIEDGLRMVSRAREWAHQITDYPITTAGPYSTGTVSINSASTAVTGSGTVFPSNVVTANAFIEFNGENTWYEVTARGGDTALTIRDAYSNTAGTNLSGATYKIVYPLYALPDNFRRHVDLFDVGRQRVMQWSTTPPLWDAHAARAGVATPQVYGTVVKRHDPNTTNMLLYPAPDGIEKFQLVYMRHTGWYDAATPATSVWKMRATADTDYVDWPESKLDILYAAILVKLYEEVDQGKVNGAYSHFWQLLQQAQEDDADNIKVRTLGSGGADEMPRQRFFIEA